jgi:heme/copper-type cytochrome/quinol oxidase subunit 4
MKKSPINLKKVLIDDRINLVFTIFSIIIYLIVFLIWHFSLRYKNMYIYSTSGIYPVRYLTIILPLNYFLGIISYRKEKEISYLLFGAGLFIALLLLILEIFYLINLNYV